MHPTVVVAANINVLLQMYSYRLLNYLAIDNISVHIGITFLGFFSKIMTSYRSNLRLYTDGS